MEKLSENMQVALKDFIQGYPPKTIKRNLLSIFFEYLFTVGEMIPSNLGEEVADFRGLLKFLDTLEDELEDCKAKQNTLEEEPVKD
jgi:hypothetical protein